MHRPATILVVYLVAVGWLTWPLSSHLTTHLANTTVTCRTDGLQAVWSLSHGTRALVSAPWSLPDANIYHPTPRAFFYGPTALGALPFFAPTFLATGNPVLATNLMLLASFALTAMGVHLVAAKWTGSEAAGLVAAGVVLSNGWLLHITPSYPFYSVLQYLPWIILLTTQAASAWRTVILASLVALQVLVEPVYYGPTVCAPLALIALTLVARVRTRREGVHLAAALTLALLAVAPVYWQYVEVAAANGWHLERVWADVARRLPEMPPGPVLRGPTQFSTSALVLVALGVASFAWRRAGAEPSARRVWGHVLVFVVVPLVLSLPSQVQVGPYVLASPLGSLTDWLGLRVFQATGRMGAIALVGTALLTGLAFAECVRSTGSVRIRRACCAAVLVSLWLFIPTSGHARGLAHRSFRLLDTATLDRPKGLLQSRAPLLELPARMEVAAAAMYRSIWHRRPLINGYASYVPGAVARRMRLATDLPNREIVELLRRETGVGHILVHLALVPNPREWRALERDQGDSGLRFTGRRPGMVLFEVLPSRVSTPVPRRWQSSRSIGRSRESAVGTRSDQGG
jgi:hypothetical protein